MLSDLGANTVGDPDDRMGHVEATDLHTYFFQSLSTLTQYNCLNSGFEIVFERHGRFSVFFCFFSFSSLFGSSFSNIYVPGHANPSKPKFQQSFNQSNQINQISSTEKQGDRASARHDEETPR